MNAISLRYDPKFVCQVLEQHRSLLSQDVETIRQRRVSAERNLPLYPAYKTISDYLRSFSLVWRSSGKSSPEDATVAARHPYILKYCRVLGVDAASIDRLFKRIVSGDLSDEIACESESVAGLKQLDIAIERASEQWLAKEPAIKAPVPMVKVVIERAKLSRKLTTTTPDEADTLLRGFADQEPSVRRESAETLATRIRASTGKTCSKNTVRKTQSWIEWNPQSKAKGKKPSRLRTGALVIDPANRDSANPLEKLIAEEDEQISEGEAKRKISALSLNIKERDAILKKLVEGEITPAVAVSFAEKIVERR